MYIKFPVIRSPGTILINYRNWWLITADHFCVCTAEYTNNCKLGVPPKFIYNTYFFCRCALQSKLSNSRQAIFQGRLFKLFMEVPLQMPPSSYSKQNRIEQNCDCRLLSSNYLICIWSPWNVRLLQRKTNSWSIAVNSCNLNELCMFRHMETECSQGFFLLF